MENFTSRDILEDLKRNIENRFISDQRELYVIEIKKILKWFKEKFPKRDLKWISGMGIHFWQLDGEILEWDSYIRVWTNHCWNSHIEEPPRDRYGKVLWPCWDIFMSIHDLSNTMGQWIDTGDIGLESI